ncbi:MAG: hypothetical protein P1U34_05720 [Coxiellaceae bacterium]|nr:hypothetical protein [Coxiellaceae bacterium]
MTPTTSVGDATDTDSLKAQPPGVYNAYLQSLTKHFFDLLRVLINDGGSRTQELPDEFAENVARALLAPTTPTLAQKVNAIVADCIARLNTIAEAKHDEKTRLPRDADLNARISELIKETIDYVNIVNFITSTKKLKQDRDSPYQPQTVSIDILDSIIGNIAITLVPAENINTYNALRKQTTVDAGDYELLLGTGNVEATIEVRLLQGYCNKHGVASCDDLAKQKHKAKASALKVIQAEMSKLQSKATAQMQANLTDLNMAALANTRDGLKQENARLRQELAASAAIASTAARRRALPALPVDRVIAAAATTPRAKPLMPTIVSDLQAQVARLEEQLAEKQAAIDAATVSDSAFMAEIEALQRQLDVDRREKAQALCRVDSAKLATRQAKIDAQQTIEPLERQVAALQAQVATLQAQVDKAAEQKTSSQSTVTANHRHTSRLFMPVTDHHGFHATPPTTPNASVTAGMNSPLLVARSPAPVAATDWIAALKQDLVDYRTERSSKKYTSGKRAGQLREHTGLFGCGGYRGSIKLDAAQALIDVIDRKDSMLTEEPRLKSRKRLKATYISALSQSGIRKSKVLKAIRKHLPEHYIDGARNNQCLVKTVIQAIYDANNASSAAPLRR